MTSQLVIFRAFLKKKFPPPPPPVPKSEKKTPVNQLIKNSGLISPEWKPLNENFNIYNI